MVSQTLGLIPGNPGSQVFIILVTLGCYGLSGGIGPHPVSGSFYFLVSDLVVEGSLNFKAGQCVTLGCLSISLETLLEKQVCGPNIHLPIRVALPSAILDHL